MIDSKYRKIFQPSFDMAGKLVVKTRLSPNQITSLALATGVTSGVLIANNQMALAGGMLLLSGLLDVLDGTVARLTNKSSPLGAFLDMVFDRMVESSVILGFYFIYPEFSLSYLLFFISVIFNFSTFTVAGALFKNTGTKSMHYDRGLAERSETFITFILMMIYPVYSGTILFCFTIIVFLTGIIRSHTIIKYVREMEAVWKLQRNSYH